VANENPLIVIATPMWISGVATQPEPYVIGPFNTSDEAYAFGMAMDDIESFEVGTLNSPDTEREDLIS
jgi:hypothetical protein